MPQGAILHVGSSKIYNLHNNTINDWSPIDTYLQNLVTYFARRADETGEREWSVITGIAERLLFDVSEFIQCERPLSRELLSRIKVGFEVLKLIFKKCSINTFSGFE